MAAGGDGAGGTGKFDSGACGGACGGKFYVGAGEE